MELTYEELKEKLTNEFGDSLKETILNSDEFKEMLEPEEKKDITPPADTEEKQEPIKGMRSAEFLRNLYKKDYGTLNKIQGEEIAKYASEWGMKTKTLSHYLTESDDAQGGYLLPREWYTDVFMIPQTGFGLARRDCNMIPMTTYSMNLNYLTVMPSTHWINAGVDLAYREKQVTKPEFGQKSLTPVVQDAIIVWEEELLADANIPLVDFTTARVREAFFRGEDDALFNGNGGLGIAGILNDGGPTLVTMGAGDVNFADIDFDDLVAMVDAVASSGVSGGKFYFHPNILAWLRQVKDTTNNYVWDSPKGNIPGTIWGYPYETTNVLPDNGDSGISTSFVVFGDLKTGVAFGDRQSVMVKLLTEATIDGTNLAQYNLNAIKFWERVDIEVIIGDAIAILETAAV